MASCDMCTKTATTKARIEGVLLSVCANCATFGTEIKVPAQSGLRSSSSHSHQFHAPKVESVLVLDFPARLRKARQKMGLSEEDAARALNIRQSTLLHFEAGKMQPDDTTTKKLEKFYNIILLEQS